MSIGNVFKLILHSHVGGTQQANIFHYRQTFGVLGGDILAQEFINEVFPDIRSILSVNTVFDSVEYLNYNNTADFGIDDSIAGVTGARSGETLPRFVCYAFSYNRETRDTRNGSKRFGSIAESDQAYGDALVTWLPQLQIVADSLGQFVNLGGTEIWRPVIARLSPDGSTVLVTNDVKNVTYTRISSQNSRKVY